MQQNENTCLFDFLLDFTFEEASQLIASYPEFEQAINDKICSELERIKDGNRTLRQIAVDTQTGLIVQYIFAIIADLKQADGIYDDVEGPWKINGYSFPDDTKYEIKALKNVTEKQCIDKIKTVMVGRYTKPKVFVFFRTQREDRNECFTNAKLAFVFAKLNDEFIKIFDLEEVE